MPSGVQLSRPIVPPGRQTRTSSSATGWWNGANIAPIADMTTSKDASSNGRCSASASAQRSSRPSASAQRAAGVEQLGGQVARGHVGAGAGRGERGVARAGRDVEHGVAGADAAGLDEPRAERQQERLDHRRVVARGPHRAVLGLEGGVVRRCLRHDATLPESPPPGHRENLPILARAQGLRAPTPVSSSRIRAGPPASGGERRGRAAGAVAQPGEQLQQRVGRARDRLPPELRPDAGGVQQRALQREVEPAGGRRLGRRRQVGVGQRANRARRQRDRARVEGAAERVRRRARLGDDVVGAARARR